MIKDGKYRFTLQFGMNTTEEQQAGNLLEQLGKKKSPVVVAALNEYLSAHPEILTGRGKIKFHVSAPDPKQLEATVRQLVTEILGTGGSLPTHADDTPVATAQQVSNDILGMLNDLDMFG